MGLAGRTVVVAVSGGIAAYKACELVRLLVQNGAAVQVIMTAHAREFVTPLTLQTLSGRPVATDTFDLTQESEIGHIKLADQADVIVVAPATANVLAKMAHGLADDLLGTVLLATRAPVVIAPAMNVHMWEHPATRANLVERSFDVFFFQAIDGRIHAADTLLRKARAASIFTKTTHASIALFRHHHEPATRTTNSHNAPWLHDFVEPAIKNLGTRLRFSFL